jgi:hypothetical protein
MIITICGSLKFFDEEVKIKEELEKLGHTVHMPVKVPELDYWEKDGASRVEAKQNLNLMGEHMKKIENSEAILVANLSKPEIENYIGANTFMEMGFAHYLGKKIFTLNPLPNQPYIREELDSINPTILNGNLESIK